MLFISYFISTLYWYSFKKSSCDSLIFMPKHSHGGISQKKFSRTEIQIFVRLFYRLICNNQMYHNIKPQNLNLTSSIARNLSSNKPVSKQ